MLSDHEPLSLTAKHLVVQHGRRAPQFVVDEIVRAVRQADLAAAKRWNDVGQEIDLLLAVGPVA